MSSTAVPLGHKLPRKSSTKGRKLNVQREPLPKGASCQTCRTRKVRCDAVKPACRACLRTARFEGRDESTVVCCYDVKPSSNRKGANRPPVSKAQQPAEATRSQGAVGASTSAAHGSTTYAPMSLAEVSVNAPYVSSFANPYLTSFPLIARNDSHESFAAPYLAASAPGPSHTPTPPLSYSSTASPEDSVIARSPPERHVAPAASTSTYGAYATTGNPASSWTGLPLPPILPGSSLPYTPYPVPPQYHSASPSLSFTLPEPVREVTTWPYPVAASARSALPPPIGGDEGAARARAKHGYSYLQHSASPMNLPRVESAVPSNPSPVPFGAPNYTAKRPNLAFHLPPPRLSTTLSPSFPSPVHYLAPHLQQRHPLHRSVGGSVESLVEASQPYSTPTEDPTFSLPLQHPSAPYHHAQAMMHTPAPHGMVHHNAAAWPALPSPSGPLTWAYPGTGVPSSGKAATTPGCGPVDEWLKGLAT